MFTLLPFQQNPLLDIQTICTPPVLRPLEPNVAWKSRLPRAMSHCRSSQNPEDGGKRPVKSNPLVDAQKDAAERRRRRFLDQIKETRERRKWETRSEEILRFEFWSEQRNRQAELERQGPQAVTPSEDEETKHFDTPLADFDEEQALVESLIQQENKELEALLALMDPVKGNSMTQDIDILDDDIDDQAYDSLFLSYLDTADSNANSSLEGPQCVEEMDLEEMDMTNG